MPQKLSVAAQMTMDLFYQDFTDRDDFFGIDDFKFHIATWYSSALDNMFQGFRKMGKQETGFANPEISSAWMITESFEVQVNENDGTFFAETQSPIYSFNFDGFGYALQSVRSAKCSPNKVSNDEWRFMDIMPATNKCYFTIEGDRKVIFSQNLQKGTFTYIPQVSMDNDDSLLSDSILPEVIKNVLQIMLGAKNGNVVHQVNDGNPNSVIGQQVNPQLKNAQ